MSGKVLIIDTSSTNRIILKVKLSAAYYAVTQAASVEEARALLPDLRPDMILLGLPASQIDTARQSIKRLHLHAPSAGTPAASIIMMLTAPNPEDRITALRAGAEDVLSFSMDEQLLMARLRRLMRRRLSDQELRHHAMTAHNLGFAEAQRGFALPGHVGLVSENTQSARRLLASLAPHSRHVLRLLGAEDVMGVPRRRLRPEPAADAGQADIFVIEFPGGDPKDTLRLLSDLRAGVGTRGCPVIPILPPEETALAAQLLDMGAGDVIFADTAPEETALRLHIQLERKRQRDRMRDQLQDGLRAAVIDPLTNLYNRRYAMSYLQCLLDTPVAEKGDFAVMLADLDYFKQVNDSHGHAAGDAVLAEVSRLLAAQLRKEDLVARIGGEEFLIIVPGATQATARRIATDLCALVRDTPIALPDQSGYARVTISIGVTLARRGALSTDDIIGQADRALYRSKAEGRNTVRIDTLSAA